MSACTAVCAAWALIDVIAATERAFKLTLESVSTRASAPKEIVRLIARANEACVRAVIESLPNDSLARVRKPGQRRPPAAPPSRDQSYFFFAFFFEVFLAAFFFAGI